ncbi:hypothetical protein [Streptomyces sp. NPDC048565]|uniref:hypothetical protein n=1 Tax=Streptomyces sp. NPDC048565 TaxID=3155266 RepID=UPI003416A1DE
MNNGRERGDLPFGCGVGFAPTESTPEEMFDAAFNIHAKAPFMLPSGAAAVLRGRAKGRAWPSAEMSVPRAMMGAWTTAL